MAVRQGRSVERSRLAWLWSRLPPCWAGLRTTCLLAGASPWRGSKEASAARGLELGVPAAVLSTVRKGRVLMTAVMIGVDPRKASHTAVAISAAEEPLGQLRGRACVAPDERLV